MRLIDADRCDEVIVFDDDNKLMQVYAVREYINNQKAFLDKFPTIDAVHVVRCKDCKHSELEFFVDNGTIRIEKYKCGNHLGMGMAQEVNADDFCSYGERKEDAD